MTFTSQMVNLMSYGIPKLWHILPFINKARVFTRKKTMDVDTGKIQILFMPLWISKIKGAFCELLASGSLSTPLRAFHQNSSHSSKLSGEKPICNPFPIVCHKWIISY